MIHLNIQADPFRKSSTVHAYAKLGPRPNFSQSFSGCNPRRNRSRVRKGVPRQRWVPFPTLERSTIRMIP